jgi:hypothetical protein
MNRLQFTVYTSTAPQRLTKVFGLAADGTLTRTTAASMSAGTAQRAAAASLTELADRLDRLTSAQAVGWGIGASELSTVVAQDADTGTDPTRVSRTRRNFVYPKGPGILMLDHDGIPEGALDRDGLRLRLIDACPALALAPMLWRPSASAGLLAPDGRELTGLFRHRLYIPVQDASLIPDAGRRLVTLLWAAGMGWHEVGNAGQAMARTLVDSSVWQPERLDFAAPPMLTDGIRRPIAAALVYGDPAALFDLSGIVTTAADDKDAAKRRRESRDAIKQQCKLQRETWAAERAPTLAKTRSITLEKARDVLIRASEHAVLMGDFMLTTADGAQVSVGDVLDHPDRWHNARFADPLDPDHDRRVAVVNLKSGTRPALYSHRHGGVRFELLRQSARVQGGKGLRIATTDAVLQVLRERGELFDFGEGAVAYVAAGRARPVSQDWLTDHMGRVCEFYVVKTRKGADGGEELVEVADDAPLAVARAVLAKHGERGFKTLVAVVTAPTLRADGSVFDVPGHDADSGLLYFSDEPNPLKVPVNPTPADALAALKFLWRPFAKFPLVDDVARGVVLHGLLTAVVRAALPTAPGIALDAPAAGTGKTLLARCIGILATGNDPAVLPPADDDAETRKRLFSALREGARVLLWDNVREPLGCAALDAFLTAGTFSDRILGVSETATLPNRAQFIATGNNLRLTGDTCRRIFLARLDAQSETPYARDFDFCPAQRIEVERTHYVVAALTIIRAFIVAGRPKLGAGRTASFELWDDLVRQPICWLKTLVAGTGGSDLPALDDPLKAAQQAFDQDPETTKHTALLHAWYGAFGDMPTTVANAVRRAETDDALLAALDEIGGQGQRINVRIVGRWNERHVGRRIAEMKDGQRTGELRFERGTLSRGLTTWIVKRVAAVIENKPTKHTTPTIEAPRASNEAADGGGSGGSGGSISGRTGVLVSEADDVAVFVP